MSLLSNVLLLCILRSVVGYDWCPQYHLIRGKNVYDPSGPIYFDGAWHVFEDSCAWCHHVSNDLLHWQSLNNTGFSGLTGSIGTTTTRDGELTFVAFYPEGDQKGIMRATSTDRRLSSWNISGMAMARPSTLNGSSNFRDPLRPIEMDGHTYLGVGSGVAPHGPGMVLWYQAMDDDWTQWQLQGFDFIIFDFRFC